MKKVPRAELETMLRKIWEASKVNWTYGGEGANDGPSPAGWTIPSDSGIMGELRDMIEDLEA